MLTERSNDNKIDLLLLVLSARSLSLSLSISLNVKQKKMLLYNLPRRINLFRNALQTYSLIIILLIGTLLFGNNNK